MSLPPGFQSQAVEERTSKALCVVSHFYQGFVLFDSITEGVHLHFPLHSFVVLSISGHSKKKKKGRLFSVQGPRLFPFLPQLFWLYVNRNAPCKGNLCFHSRSIPTTLSGPLFSMSCISDYSFTKEGKGRKCDEIQIRSIIQLIVRYQVQFLFCFYFLGFFFRERFTLN